MGWSRLIVVSISRPIARPPSASSKRVEPVVLLRLKDGFGTIDGGDLLEHLRAENARLIALLQTHGVDWRLPDEPPLVELASPPSLISSSLDTDAKLAFFKRLVRGRADVFPVRWESKTGKSGLRPWPMNGERVCAEQPRLKCGDCTYRHHKAQAMRLPVWNKPRLIGCAEILPQEIGLTRGCV